MSGFARRSSNGLKQDGSFVRSPNHKISSFSTNLNRVIATGLTLNERLTKTSPPSVSVARGVLNLKPLLLSTGRHLLIACVNVRRPTLGFVH